MPTGRVSVDALLVHLLRDGRPKEAEMLLHAALRQAEVRRDDIADVGTHQLNLGRVSEDLHSDGVLGLEVLVRSQWLLSMDTRAGVGATAATEDVVDAFLLRDLALDNTPLDGMREASRCPLRCRCRRHVLRSMTILVLLRLLSLV